MKKVILSILMIFSLYLMLYSTRILLRYAVIDKKDHIGYMKQNEFKNNPNCHFNEKLCLLNLDKKIKNNTQFHSTAFGFGSVLFLVSLFLYFRLQYSGINILANKRVIVIRFLEGIIHIGYWLLIGLLYFVMQMMVKHTVSGCVIDSMFMFYVAGFTGFYSSYFYLTNKYLATFKFWRYILLCVPVILFASILAYFIPFYGKDIANLKAESFTNPVFFQGFILMAFFIFANITMGSIVKGFINWMMRM
jgi:hypothetical protein